MKPKITLINISLVLFVAGLMGVMAFGMKVGAVTVLTASAFLLITYTSHISQSISRREFLSLDNLLYSIGMLMIAVIFIHGFSTAIDMMFVRRLQAFTVVYYVVGLLIPILFVYFSLRVSLANREFRVTVAIGTSISAALAVVGYIGLSGLAEFPVKLVFYSWVFMLFFYLVVFLKSVLSKGESRIESLRLLAITILFIGFWFFRFNLPNALPDGLPKAIIHFGFIPILIFPITILSVRKFHPFLIFILYFLLLDFYFIQFDSNYRYLVQVGVNGCEGYDERVDFPINVDPGLPIAELLKEPSKTEIDEIISEWQMKDFTPQGIQIVHSARMANGDSIKVISHLVNGLRHYGAIRIPRNVDVRIAPILLVLEGGGTGLDVSKISTLTQGKCQTQRQQFISILPSYRGCILRGEDFCFKSEGYFGDAWLGPAEDAIAFLEVVKKVYDKSDSTRVLAHGISRGATVALIIGGLTEKVDYIIANSTHTKFLDQQVFDNERVGGSRARAFYTPKASSQIIRKRFIASSPYYFADQLPPFDLHQGTEDRLTTIWHARMLQERLMEINKDPSTFNFFIYEGQGHGYDDDEIVCESIMRFIGNEL